MIVSSTILKISFKSSIIVPFVLIEICRKANLGGCARLIHIYRLIHRRTAVTSAAAQ